MYVVKGMSVNEISAILKVSNTTIYRWKDREGWEDKRKMHQNVFRSTLLALENKLESITKDLDKLAKNLWTQLTQKSQEKKQD
jgi:transposase